MSKNNKDVKRGIVLYIDGKEVKRDVTDIKAEIRKLTKELDRMTIGSKEYNEQMAKIRHLNSIVRDHKGRLREVNEELGKSHFNAGKLVDGFNRFGGVVLAAIGFLTGFALALRSIREERNKLESSQAGLKALTGLDDSSIAWLTEQAKTLSTTMTEEGLRVRQSAAEILDAFMLVGSAKPELLGDKEALKQVTEEAMRLQAAAGDITLNEAVDSLTLSLNQYGAAADQASRFVNVLAAGSKEGAVNIASQAKAIQKAGTMAATLNIPIEELVGSIEMLGEKGVKDEIAGTGLKTFFTRLATGATDTNPKVVGLANALDNLNKQVEAAESKQAGGGTSLLKKIFGDEGMQVAMILTQNTEKVKEYTAAVTGTNVAYEQSAINSATAAAKLDQARNQMKLAAIDLGERLNPALTVSTNMMTNVVKFLPGVIDWFQKWGTTIVWLSIVIATYTLRTKAITIVTTTWNTVTKIGAAIQLAYGIAMNTVNGYTITSLTQMRKLSVIMAGHNVLMKALRTGTYLYAAGVHLLRGRVDLCAKSMRAAWVVMNLNPMRLITTVAIAAASAFLLFRKRVDEAAERQKRINEINAEAATSIGEEKSKLEALRKVLTDSSKGYAERKSALDQIQAIVPEYHASLTKEGKLINDNKEALDGYIEKLLISAKQQAANSKLQEAISARTTWVNEQNSSDNMRFKNIEWSLNDSMNQKSTEELSIMEGVSPTAYRVWAAKKAQLDKEVAFYESMMATYTEDLAKVDAKYKKANGSNGDGEKCPKCGNSPCTCRLPEEDSEKKKRIQKELERIETDHMQQMTHLQKLYLEGEIKTDEEYTALQIDLEKKTLDEKLKIAGLESHDREQLQVKMLEAQIKFNQECKKQDEKTAKDKKTAEEKTAKERLSIRQRQLRIELENAASSHYRSFTSEEEYAKEVNDIRQRYWNDLLDNYQLTEEERTRITEEQATSQANAEEKKYEKIMKLNSQYADMVEDIASGFSETIGEMITNGELTIKNFLKETILMALDALERVIEITCLEVMVKNLAATAPFSFIGAAKAALQIMAIKASFAVVKGVVGNFYTGGYTGSGEWDQPQGIVHSNEFVANRYAVANPAVRPVLDLIDGAQRTGSIANLTAQDIASVVGGSSATKATPAAQIVQVGSGHSDVEMTRTMQELNSVITKLVGRLNDPFYTLNVISGRSGLKNKLDEYETLLNNKSRKS